MRHFTGKVDGGSKSDGLMVKGKCPEGSVTTCLNHYNGKDHWEVEVRDHAGNLLQRFTGEFK